MAEGEKMRITACSLIGQHQLMLKGEGRGGAKKKKAATIVCVCVCFLPIHSGHQVRWTYQPGSHRRRVTLDF